LQPNKNPLIEIDNVLISDEVVEEKFVCDLNKCKGGCCVDGDAGAPLHKNELDTMVAIFDKVKPYLTPEGLKEIERKGLYVYDVEFGWVTPTIESKVCAYGFSDEKGIVKCGIEQAYLDGKISWKKPISCHLFPIRIKENKGYHRVNYEPRQELCAGGCSLGKKLKVPAYQFLKEALVRKYGEDFYNALDTIAREYYNG
jgi:Protein of unknown function (DUF3109)